MFSSPSPAPSPTPAHSPHASGGRSWVPIRSLGTRHRTRVAQHLLQLSPGDRYLRFGYAATDAQIARYVDSLDFDRDEIFGIFNRRLDLIAVAHLAHPIPVAESGSSIAEFGVSVLPRSRGRGFGRRLFEHATLHARNRGIGTMLIHALSENAAMLKIARNAGAVVTRHGSESQALLSLPEDSFASHLGEAAGRRAAELDYGLKVQALSLHELVDAVNEVKSQIGASHVASE
jgi:GNAT superfamily N-acetyltransferase